MKSCTDVLNTAKAINTVEVAACCVVQVATHDA